MIRGFFDKDEPEGGGAIPTRDQVPADDTWDLAHLYPTPVEWDKDFTDLQGRYDGVTQFRGRVGESAQTLLAALEFDKSLSLQIERLYHYASLKTSEDSSDAANLARESQMQNLLTRIGEACSFLTPELQAIDDATFARYLADPALAEWVISLRKDPAAQTAHAQRRGGAAAGTWEQRAEGTQRDVLAAYRCGHEIRQARPMRKPWSAS